MESGGLCPCSISIHRPISAILTKKYCILYNRPTTHRSNKKQAVRSQPALHPTYNYFRLLFFDAGLDLTEALTPLFVEYTLTLPTRAKNPMIDPPFRRRTLRQRTPSHDHYSRDEML